MPSVVIAAHNEQSVIGRTLDSVLSQQAVGQLQIVVSANACADATAQIARDRGVDVIDRAEPGKAAAINAAEERLRDFPRVYLDADVVVPPGGFASLFALLDSPSAPLAVVPRRRIDVSGRPALVRGYIAINRRLPVFRDGLFGRGLIVLSEQGRRRFDRFPTVVADDLFLDSQFLTAEKRESSDVEVVVQAPFTTRALLNRLIRVRRGNTQLRASNPGAVRSSDKWAWLKDVVLREPRLVFAAVPYVGLTILAGLIARRQARAGTGSWGRDDSTRKDDGPSS